MIKLFQFPRTIGWNVANISIPCLKLETWLRITELQYEVASWPPPMPLPNPKRKLPFIEDDGVLVADSTFIIEHLKRTRGIDPDQGLTPTERAIGVAFRRMLEENLYWVLLYDRYQNPAGWDVFRKSVVSSWFGGDTPETLVLQEGARKTSIDFLAAQGMGRHTEEEVHQIGCTDLAAVSDFLGQKLFFFGDKPTGVDATVYAAVTNCIDVPMDGPLARFGRDRKNLVDYCQRMRERFFSDLSASP
jgi:glutathione S-transferase